MRFGPVDRIELSPRWLNWIIVLLASVGLAAALLPTLPLLGNADDHMRYYVGGYVGAARMGLAPPLEGFTETVASARRDLAPENWSRFLAALTPYSPSEVAQIAVTDPLRRTLVPGVDLPLWIVVTASLRAVAWLTVLTFLTRRLLPELSWPWLLASFAVTSFFHGHTHPFAAEPRGLSTFATALAFGVIYTGGRARAAYLLLLLGAALHPYLQILNLLTQCTILVLLGPKMLRASVRFMVPAWIFALASLAATYALSPLPDQNVTSLLGASADSTWYSNWTANGGAAVQVSRYMAPAVALLLVPVVGPFRSVLGGLAVVASEGLIAVLFDSGVYLGEYPNRLGGAWNCVILTLLLRKDLLVELQRLSQTRRRVATLALVAGLLFVSMRMDASIYLRATVGGFVLRVVNGAAYVAGPVEAAGLSLIPSGGSAVPPARLAN